MANTRKRLNVSHFTNQERESSKSLSQSVAKKKKESTLSRILSTAGIILQENDPGAPVELEGDQISLHRKLRDELESESMQKELVSDLKESIEDSDRLRLFASSSRFTAASGLSTRPGGQDSTLHLLLGVHSVQMAVVEGLLARVVELLGEEEEELALFVLEQLKWLDQLADGEALCGMLLDVMSDAPLVVKKGMVLMLPAILQDDQHQQLASALTEKLNEDEELVPAIVECLGNLNVTNPDLICNVLETAINAIGSISNLGDIPVLIRFVIQNTDAKNILSVVQEVRSRIDCFDASFIPPSHSSTQGGSPSSPHSAEESAIVEALKYSIWFQKSVADAWTKAVQLVQEAKEHKVVDALVLFILHSVPARKKAVENIFVVKIKSKQFTEEFLDMVFGIGPETLKEYFPSILSLSSDLLCVHNSAVTSFASVMFQNMFKCFDVFCQQEVVGTLVTHVGSGSSPEVDAAFDVLSALVRTYSVQMMRFDLFIKGILDYLEKLSMPQIRQLYSIISVLARDEDSGLGDEMRTIIGKQLSHSSRHFRHIGIVGGVMMIKEFGRNSASDDDIAPMLEDEATVESSSLATARSLLDQVVSEGCRSADTTMLFNDELSMAVQENCLHPSLLNVLMTRATDTLEELYLIESSDPLPESAVSLEYNAGLDSVDACAVALNLMPLVLTQYDSVKRGVVDRSSVLCLPSHFHLLRTCVSVVNAGDLRDIDALLGCPVVMCTASQLDPEAFHTLDEARRNGVCLSLFLCLNWYLESVCAFAAEEDSDMRWKVMKRLENVVEVEQHLERCIAQSPSFIGFLHNVLGLEMETGSSAHGSGKKVAQKGKSKPPANTTLASTTLETSQETAAAVGSEKAAPNVLNIVRHFYRPLGLDVFRVLTYEPIQRPLSQGESEESIIQSTPHVTEVVKVELSMVVFLLDNLHWKVFAALNVFGSRKGPHSKLAHAASGIGPTPLELVKLVVQLLPALCQYLEASSAFFQVQSEENDGIEDAFDLDSSDARMHCAVLSIILKILSTVLSWPKLSDPEHKDLLSGIAHVLAGRIGSSTASNSSRVYRNSLTYLKGFGSSMPTLSCVQHLVKCLVNLCRTGPPSARDASKEQVAELCTYLLKKPWSDFDKLQPSSKDAIAVILKFAIAWSKDPLQEIENVIQDTFVQHLSMGVEGGDELEGTEGRGKEVYATFSEKTMSHYYQTLLTALVDAVKGSLPTKTSAMSTEVQVQGLAVLGIAFKLFPMLINLVKTTERRTFLGAALKSGRLLIDVFLRQGMPLLYVVFRARQEEVLLLLKSLQQSTRSLHHFCGHSKVRKDLSLTNRVPAMKRCLETLLFKVKSLLAEHNCQEAFVVGNLKNRDLRGQEVSSQMSQSTQPEQEPKPEPEPAQDDEVEAVDAGVRSPFGNSDEAEELLSSESEEY